MMIYMMLANLSLMITCNKRMLWWCYKWDGRWDGVGGSPGGVKYRVFNFAVLIMMIRMNSRQMLVGEMMR